MAVSPLHYETNNSYSDFTGPQMEQTISHHLPCTEDNPSQIGVVVIIRSWTLGFTFKSDLLADLVEIIWNCKWSKCGYT